jgi:hypothetical protein
MIETGDHQREALAVLSECTDPGAEAYKQRLQRQPVFAAQIKVVKDEMNQLF